MTRTQIQLPDVRHAHAKRIAKQQEMSLAELVGRGLEHMVRPYSVQEKADPEWELPALLELGKFLAPVDDWGSPTHVASWKRWSLLSSGFAPERLAGRPGMFPRERPY